MVTRLQDKDVLVSSLHELAASGAPCAAQGAGAANSDAAVMDSAGASAAAAPAFVGEDERQGLARQLEEAREQLQHKEAYVALLTQQVGGERAGKARAGCSRRATDR